MADRYSYSIDAQDRTKGAVRSAQRGLEGLNRSVKSIDGAITKLTGGLAAMAGVAGIGALVNSMSQSIDRLGKLSSQLGITAQDVRELGLAAELSGVSQDQLSVALATIQKNAGDAARGTGEAQVAFRELGINAEYFATLGVDDQLELVADRFGRLTTDSQRTNTAMKLFGESGRALIPLLNGGSAGIAGMREEARKLGGTLTQDGVRSVEAMNDAFSKMKYAITSQIQIAFAELAPEIEQGINRAIEWIKDNGPDIMSGLGAVIKSVGNVVKWVADKWDYLKWAVLGVTLGMSGLIPVVFKAIETTAGMVKIFGALIRHSGDLAKGVVGVKQFFGAWQSAIVLLAGKGYKAAQVLVSIGATLKAIPIWLMSFGPALLAITAGVSAIVYGLKKWYDHSQEQKRALEEQREQLRLAREEMDDYAESMKAMSAGTALVALSVDRNTLSAQLKELETQRDLMLTARRTYLVEFGETLKLITKPLSEEEISVLEDLERQIDHLKARLEQIKGLTEEVEEKFSALTEEVAYEVKFSPATLEEEEARVKAIADAWKEAKEEILGYIESQIPDEYDGNDPLPPQDQPPAWLDEVTLAAKTLRDAGNEFIGTMSSGMADIFRDGSIGWDMKFQELGRNFGHIMAQATRNWIAYMVEEMSRRLAALAAKKVIGGILGAIASAIHPSAGAIVQGIFDMQQNSVAIDGGGRSLDGAPQVVFQSVIPPSQNELRRAGYVINDSFVANRRFRLA